jgi:hypothetical protein
MAFRQYTRCYNHTPGDKPFNKSDLMMFVLGASAPGLIIAILGFLAGSAGNIVGFVAIIIQYAVTITAVANEWLHHRLCCISGDQCAVGTVESPPAMGSLLGEFDNDQYFDIRLMPHRHQDEYRAPNTRWNETPPRPGLSLDGESESHPQNDIFLDLFQGTTLLKPFFTDLPYRPVSEDAPALAEAAKLANFDGTVTRCTLHCEAEGSFWSDMKATAALQGIAVGGGAAVGGIAGAEAGCAIGVSFCGIGCIAGAIIGGIIGALGGGALGGYLAASAAFNSDPGNVNDANVGDGPLGDLHDQDQVVVFGTLVYDGFHEGWHEFHPLKAVIKASDPKIANLGAPYLEWDPAFPSGSTPPAGLTAADMRAGLASPAFATAAKKVQNDWCRLVREAFDPATVNTQSQPEHRWAVHPLVDGCSPQVVDIPLH